MDSHQQYLADLAAIMPKATQLRESEEALELSKYRYGKHEEAEMEALALAYVAKAAELGVPGRFWFGTAQSHQRNAGMLFSLHRRPNMQRALKLLVESGASVWAGPLQQGKPDTTDPSLVCQAIFPGHHHGSIALGSRKAVVNGAFRGLPDLSQPTLDRFLDELCSRYKDATSSSSLTSAGVLGRGDKRAKESAELALALGPRLIEAAAERSPGSLAKIEAMLADAKVRQESKARKGAEAFDPEKLKKSLTPEQRQRLMTLSHLAESCSEDGDAMRVMMDATPWLREHPQALCINMRSRMSLASIAFTCAREETLQALDKFGSNIWLAAAQAGEGNACLWAASLLSHRRFRATESESARMKSMVGIVAKLLAYGAFLDGAADPVAHAVAKADEAIATVKSRNRSEELIASLLELRGRMEALALADLLAGRGEGEGEGEQEPPPPRRSRSL